MKKDNDRRTAEAGKWKPDGEGIFKNRPALEDACRNPWWEDKTYKGCWSLSCNWDQGMPTASLNDKVLDRSLNTTAETFEAALELLEALLASAHRPWRYWNKGKGKRG